MGEAAEPRAQGYRVIKWQLLNLKPAWTSSGVFTGFVHTEVSITLGVTGLTAPEVTGLAWEKADCHQGGQSCCMNNSTELEARAELVDMARMPHWPGRGQFRKQLQG